MSDENDRRDQIGSPPPRNQDSAEGSREDVNATEDSGVSNWPLEEEERRQQKLPSHGDRTGDADA